MVAWNLKGRTVSKRALRRQKSCLFVQDRAEELICRAESLHKEVALSLTDHLHSLSNRRKLVRIVHYSEDGHIYVLFLARLGYKVLITHECHIRQSKLNSLCRCSDCMAVYAPCGNHSLPRSPAAEFREDLFESSKHDYSSFWTMFIVSRAIISSSLVVIAAILTFESGRVSITSSPAMTFAS